MFPFIVGFIVGAGIGAFGAACLFTFIVNDQRRRLNASLLSWFRKSEP